MKIAIITPKFKNDYLANTIIDGLLQIGVHECRFSFDYVVPAAAHSWKVGRSDFLSFAKTADLIFFIWGKNNIDYDTAREIGRWDKTIFIDGSEVGKDNRYNKKIMQQVLKGIYGGLGAINAEMLEKCALYFRREKPYKVSWSPKEIIPLPFGIESRYLSKISTDKNKDIDFACIFGQEDYPRLRKHVRKYLEKFCKKNGFTCVTEKTKNADEFYEILSRAKVGISVGGGGFDTARFWEILGNNCLLMTETVDIYEPGSRMLDFKRITQFADLEDFKVKLESIAHFLRNGYDQNTLNKECATIIAHHSSRARVESILEMARSKGIV